MGDLNVMLRRFPVLAVFFVLVLLGAGQAAGQVPDCLVAFSFTTATSLPTNGFDNRQLGCTTWVVTYNSTGFTGLTMTVQSAPNSGGSPGSWSTFTPVNGSNPETATTQATATFGGLTSYFPFVRVTLSGLTGSGTVRGALYGWKTPAVSVAGTGGGGGTTQDVNIQQIAGVTQVPCNLQSSIDLTSSGNTEIIAASGSTSIHVCRLVLSGSAAVDFKLTYGTGTNCGTGTTAFPGPGAGLLRNVITIAVDLDDGTPLIVPAGKALCANLSTNANFGGWVVFGRL